jgi:hypothetical protein
VPVDKCFDGHPGEAYNAGHMRQLLNVRLLMRCKLLFGQPDGNISNVTAGVISTAHDARNMQFGLRFVF